MYSNSRRPARRFVFGGVIGSAWEASGSDNFTNVPPRRAGEEAGAELVFESAELTTAL